jgi:hypothetical protein
MILNQSCALGGAKSFCNNIGTRRTQPGRQACLHPAEADMRPPRRWSGCVESPGGISPPGAPKTVREPLDSHGSRCSAIGTRATGFTSSTGSSCCQMASVGPWPRLNNAAPSVQPHYRAFIPTTGHSAPVLRLGTLVLAVLAACDFSLCIGVTGSHVPYKSQVELRAAYMPDAARAVSGLPPS